MSAVDYCICIEELARVDPAWRCRSRRTTASCSAHIAMFGNEAQKQKYLVPLARGEKIGAWGLTEATSGSDAAGMRTTATRDGDCWVLNGSKTFITHGRVGDVLVVMAVTDRVGGRRRASRRSSSSAARRVCSPGKKEDKLGMRASETSEVIFENCRDSGRSAARRRRTGLHQDAAGARCRTHRHCGAVGRPGAGRVRSGAPLRAGAQAVRQDDRQLSRRFSGSSPTTRRASKRRAC